MLNQLAAAVREETYRKLKSHRLSPRCFGLMLVLAECPGINQSDLGARIGVDSTTMSELVDELTVNGLITREINALDRRRKELVLTNEGHQSLSNAAITAAAVEKRLTGALAPTDVETLRDLLAKLLKSVNAHQKTPPRRNEH